MSWEARRKALTHIWHWLHVYAQGWYEDSNKKRKAIDKKLDDALEGKHSIMAWHEVDDLTKSRSVDVLDLQPQVIKIRPPKGDEGAVAALTSTWWREAGRTHCRIYYGVWSMVDPLSGTVCEDGSAGRVPVFWGYRFETPERGSNHAYHHCQPCRSLGPKGTASVLESIQVSERYPTWPLAAKDEVDLALCLILALYGFDGFELARDWLLQSAKGPAAIALTEAFLRIEDFHIQE
ncbi:hypothetical protein O6V14_16895 [Sphingomonas faeni]|uniref:hypothetical protein n=1 Tax=Sphingomonas faeni TaxID=185950 RepID=UPI00335259EC